jgi:O-antigen/teichoic acid export membrane protein
VTLGPESEPSEPTAAPVPQPKEKPKIDPAKQAGVLVLGTTLATLSSALAPLLIVRLIGKADVGRLLSVTLVYETVAMLLSTGFPYTLLYQTSNREKPERAAIARRIAGIACGMGAAGAALVVLVSLILRARPFGYEPSATFEAQLGMLIVLAPSLVADLPFRLMPNLLVAEGLARRQAGLQVIRTIALTMATLVPLALQASVATVIVCYAAVRWVFGAWVLVELRRLYHAEPRVPVPLSTGAFWRFAIPIGMTEAIAILNQQLDRWLVLLALPAVRFAEYQVGAWQVPVIGTIAYSVGAAYTPELVKHFQAKDPQGALALWQKSIHKVSLIVLPVTMALVVGAEELVTLLFTKDYSDAASVFRFYSVLTFLRVASYGNVIVAAGRPTLAVRAAGLGLFYNALFGIPLVLSLGFVGPAVAAACAFVLQVATYVFFISRAACVSVLDVFPMAGYLRVLSLAAVGGVAGYFVKRLLAGHVLAAFLLEVLTVLAVFTALGLVTRTIARADLAYARDWLKLKIVR